MGVKIISDNRKARHDFEIVDTIEAGLVLMGSEVKSLRAGQCQLKDSYVTFRGDEAFLQNAHISVYKPSSYNNHDPERLRKILLHREELNKMLKRIQEKGLSVVPLKLYFKAGRVKVQLGFAKGKKKFDKRESIKKRDANRELARSLKNSK